jgi:hypothetical protein
VLYIEYQAYPLQEFVLVTLPIFLDILLLHFFFFNSVVHLSYGELKLDPLLCRLSFKDSDLFLKFNNLFLFDQVFQLLDAFT